MKYRGHVMNGVVVLDPPNGLADGTLVEVEPVHTSTTTPRRGSAEAILRHAGIWQSQAEEVERMLDELRQSKQAEVEAQRRVAPASDETPD